MFTVMMMNNRKRGKEDKEEKTEREEEGNYLLFKVREIEVEMKE
jgi:hypothetical protein